MIGVDIWEFALQSKLTMTLVKFLLLGPMFEVQILHRDQLRLLKFEHQGNDCLIRTVHKSFEGTVKVKWIIKVRGTNSHNHINHILLG